MPFRAIFYDLDGTLRMNVPNGWRAFTEFADDLGIKTSEADRRRAARWEHYYFAESPELRSDRDAFSESTDFWSNYGCRQLAVLGASPAQAAALAETAAPAVQAAALVMAISSGLMAIESSPA